MNSGTTYPVLLILMVTASFVGAWFAVLGSRWSAAFDAPFWTAFSATLLAHTATLTVTLALYLTGAAAAVGGYGLIVGIPLVLLLVTAVLYGVMIHYPRGGGAVGVSLGIRIAIVQLGLTALTGILLVAAIHLIS